MSPSLEVLVEELSAEYAFTALLPAIVPETPYEVRVFQGKPDLLKKLPDRLRGYAKWPAEARPRVVVLVDRDNDDCRELRQRLDDMARAAGLSCSGPDRAVLNRVACEELEAWFFGDFAAINSAYPRVPSSAAARKAYRDSDAIVGGTWEALERLLQKHGYHRGGLAKTNAALEIADHMDVEQNSSRSFQVFRDGLRELVKGRP